ncbi:MAG: ZIP family metal transporter [Candidatus Brockarchaeota archaeon]|nr:ZIP family metal transporter [Candidatus Brockarchaeota archaeon]
MLGTDTLLWVVGSVTLVSLCSLVGAATFVAKGKLLGMVLLTLVGFSAGALMGGAFLHILPEALDHSESAGVFLYVIFGFSFFFLMEKFLYWRHCHKGQCDIHTFTYVNLMGDGIHNFIDGLVIASSFITGIPIGIATTLAVITHEIPQELGDFGVLVYGGFTKHRALLFNLLSQTTAIAGGIIGYFFVPNVEGLPVLMLPFAAGGFIYISGSDLIPELHKQEDARKSILSFALFLIGVLSMWMLKFFLEH